MPSPWSFLVSNPRWNFKKTVYSVLIRCAAVQMSVWPCWQTALFESCISSVIRGLVGLLITVSVAMKSPTVIVETVYFTQSSHLFFRERFRTSHAVILNCCLRIAILNDILKTYGIVEIVLRRHLLTVGVSRTSWRHFGEALMWMKWAQVISAQIARRIVHRSHLNPCLSRLSDGGADSQTAECGLEPTCRCGLFQPHRPLKFSWEITHRNPYSDFSLHKISQYYTIPTWQK